MDQAIAAEPERVRIHLSARAAGPGAQVVDEATWRQAISDAEQLARGTGAGEPGSL